MLHAHHHDHSPPAIILIPVNGGESTLQKTLTEKKQLKQQQEESQDSVEYVHTGDHFTPRPMNQPDNPTVLTLDEDSSPEIDSDIDPYGELEE